MDEKITKTIQETLINYFQVANMDFDWNKTLVTLQPKFKLLAYLIEWQYQISQHLNAEIILIGKVNTSIHSPKDIVKIISSQLD
jgi:hypothetical protein